MSTFLTITVISHVIAGIIALISGPVAMITNKGNQAHRKAGKVYFVAMTYVFISAVTLSSIKFIPFLFMISFLSYYGCFSGVRILKLKKLHKGQRAAWYDWLAGGVTLLAGLCFVGYGIWWLSLGTGNSFAGLSIFFGLFTLNSAWGGLKLFVRKPAKPMYWWFYHINGMMGSFIAAATAFSTTIARVLQVHHWLFWVAPALVGVPLIIMWSRKYRKQFAARAAPLA